MNKVRFGIVGIGNMGSTHACNMYNGEISGAELVAVCDIEKNKEEWAKENLKGVSFFEDYKDMLKTDLIDAVIIATPHYLHPTIACYAFEQGLNVLTEKPAGVRAKYVEKMNEAAKKSGKVFGIMYNQRVNPVFQKAREIIQSGEIGDVIRFVWIITNWYRRQTYYESSNWRATWKGEGGGVLINQCPHNIDIIQWMLGMPKRVWGHCLYGQFHDIEVEDDVSALFEFENGATGVFITSTGENPGGNHLEISGTKGKMILENGRINMIKFNIPETEYVYYSNEEYDEKVKHKFEKYEPGECETGLAHKKILQNFTNSILTGEELIAPGYDGIKGVNIINGIHLSDWKNERVELPVDGDVFEKMLDEKISQSKEKKNSIKDTSINLGQASNRWEVKW